MSPQVSIVESSRPILGAFHVEYAAGSAPRLDEYRLRHRVFVEERHWLPNGPSSGLERDEFDDACCALLLRDVLTGEPAACQRFILPDRLPPGAVTNVVRLARRFGLDFACPPHSAWAEVSRSTIARPYRWGGSAVTGMPTMAAIEYASVALAMALKRQTLFSISDPRIARLARRLGFVLHQVGGPIEFHGVRSIFRIDVTEVLRSVPPAMAETMDCLSAAAARMLASRPNGASIDLLPAA